MNKVRLNNFDIKDFPILYQNDDKNINRKRLVYLDNAATTQKPKAVIDALASYYETSNANPHRGAYDLSIRATEIYDKARADVRAFLNAKNTNEIIFTKNATEAFNLLAYSYGMSQISEGDEIVLSIAEHHSNLVPWQQVAKIKGARLNYLYLDENGEIPAAEIDTKITDKTKIVGITHVSNVLGIVNPVERVIERAHAVGAVVVMDIAQSVPHLPIDVQALNVDFAIFSAHKMYAPMGIGVLYGKEHLLEEMPPFLFGGDMIEYVSEQEATFAPLPQKFEGGTQNVEAAAGLSAAIRYMNQIGLENIEAREKELTQYALEKLSENPHVQILGTKDIRKKSAVISFNIQDAHPHDVATILDASGIAIRSGHHCAHPLMRYLGITASCRMSLSFYNTAEDIDALAAALKDVRRVLHIES